MATITPHASNHQSLGDFASRYVDVDELPWKPTPFPGVDLKILMQNEDTGLLTALTRFAPGAKLPLHEHTDLEQSYVLEGSLVDDEGVATAGNYVWRPAGSTHEAHAPEGALVLSFFLSPNRFVERPPR
ncbi:MAG: cupin domain-containing protein [Alphaproteobacteria bacterium]